MQQRDAVLSGRECSALFFPSQNELKSECPHMCAYKLVTVKFRWWGLQTKVENIIHKVGPGRCHQQPPAFLTLFCLSQQEKRIFTNFHRQLFCWIDKWVGLTMEDIRRMEDETQRELEEVLASPAAPALFLLLQRSCRRRSRCDSASSGSVGFNLVHS